VTRGFAATWWLLSCAACVPAASACAAQGPQPEAAGFELAADLEHGAFRVPGAPNVVVHAPARFDAARPLQLVVFLHGYSGCISVLVGRGSTRCKSGDAVAHQGWDLARYHDAARTNTLFVVPQLAFMKRDGDPGAFEREGGFREFLAELLRGALAARLGGPRSVDDVASIDLVAHSGGYRAALAILEHGGLAPTQLHSVVLFDALYGETARFADVIEQRSGTGLRFVDISLANGTPERESRNLLQRLQKTLAASQTITAEPEGIAQAIARAPIVIAHGTPPHRLVPATHLAAVLTALHHAR
jgi:hypothetical protein